MKQTIRVKSGLWIIRKLVALCFLIDPKISIFIERDEI